MKLHAISRAVYFTIVEHDDTKPKGKDTAITNIPLVFSLDGMIVSFENALQTILWFVFWYFRARLHQLSEAVLDVTEEVYLDFCWLYRKMFDRLYLEFKCSSILVNSFWWSFDN